jgi:hypothetical protein
VWFGASICHDVVNLCTKVYHYIRYLRIQPSGQSTPNAACKSAASLSRPLDSVLPASVLALDVVCYMAGCHLERAWWCCPRETRPDNGCPRVLATPSERFVLRMYLSFCLLFLHPSDGNAGLDPFSVT